MGVFPPLVERLPCVGVGFTPCVLRGAEDETWHYLISVSFRFPLSAVFGVGFLLSLSCSVRFKGN